MHDLNLVEQDDCDPRAFPLCDFRAQFSDKATTSSHFTPAGVGREKISSSVLRCLAFIDIWY